MTVREYTGADRREDGPEARSTVAARWELTAFFDRYAVAFAVGDAREVAECFAVPVTVVTDDGALTVSGADAVAEGFGRVVDQHRAHRLTSMRHHLEAVEYLTPVLCEATVRWTYRDDEDRVRFHDRYRYLMRWVPGLGPRVQIVVVLGGPVPG